MGRVVFLFLTQALLAAIVAREIIISNTEQWYEFTTVWIVFTRFMCGLVLHVRLSSKL